jgi:hypothetical protein
MDKGEWKGLGRTNPYSARTTERSAKSEKKKKSEPSQHNYVDLDRGNK